MIQFYGPDNNIVKTESATLDDAACYLGLRDGWVIEAPFAEDVRWRHLRLHRDTLVHLSTYEGYLVACSARQVTLIDLSHFKPEPHQRGRPFRDDGVTIQRARVVQHEGMAYLLVVGLDQQRRLHASTSWWSPGAPVLSGWLTWITDTPRAKDFVWHPFGEIEWEGRWPDTVLDITRHGRIMVGSSGQHEYLDLERGTVESFRIPIPQPWPDSTADQTSPNLVCCSRELRTSGNYFRSMVPFSETRLGHLPPELRLIIFSQVSTVGHMVEQQVTHGYHRLSTTMGASMPSCMHVVISSRSSRAFAPSTVSTTPSCRRRREGNSGFHRIR